VCNSRCNSRCNTAGCFGRQSTPSLLLPPLRGFTLPTLLRPTHTLRPGPGPPTMHAGVPSQEREEATHTRHEEVHYSSERSRDPFLQEKGQGTQPNILLVTPLKDFGANHDHNSMIMIAGSGTTRKTKKKNNNNNNSILLSRPLWKAGNWKETGIYENRGVAGAYTVLCRSSLNFFGSVGHRGEGGVLGCQPM